MTERFKKAYDALVKAFFEGTLAKGTCMACACGNIIADAAGIPITKKAFQEEQSYMQNCTVGHRPDEAYIVQTMWAPYRYLNFGEFGRRYVANEEHKHVVNLAGYTVEEFAAIETAFEQTSKIHMGVYHAYTEEKILEDQYNGLCAVVDVLIALDEAKENPDELKAKFREHPKLQLVG